MRVVCDNCGASYKIPDSKLTRDVNKATCRKCGNPILIRRPDEAVARMDSPETATGEERTQITSAAEMERQARSRGTPIPDDGSMDPRPTQVSPDNSGHESTVPRDESAVLASTAVLASAAVEPTGDRSTLIQPPSSVPSPFMAAPARQVASALPPPASPFVAPVPVPVVVAPPPLASKAPPSPPPAYLPKAAPLPAASAGAKSSYDPRGDLTFAAFLSSLAVVGALIGVGNAALGDVRIGAAGTFFGVAGATGAALVILTGARGTRPAGLILGGAGGFSLGAILAMAHLLAAGMIAPNADSGKADSGPVAAAIPRPAPALPQVAPADPSIDALGLAAAVDPAPQAEGSAGTQAIPPAPQAIPAAPLAFAPPPQAAPPVSAPPKAAPPPAAKVEPPPKAPERIVPKAEPAPKPKAAPVAAKAEAPASASPDTRVIDTMMKSNKGVKLCFIREQKSSGTLPSGVKVKLTIQPSGSVSSASIPSGEYAGTDFDACLSGAVKAINFPPFGGDALTLRFAF